MDRELIVATFLAGSTIRRPGHWSPSSSHRLCRSCFYLLPPDQGRSAEFVAWRCFTLTLLDSSSTLFLLASGRFGLRVHQGAVWSVSSHPGRRMRRMRGRADSALPFYGLLTLILLMYWAISWNSLLLEIRTFLSQRNSSGNISISS